jgi:hypothetical protein
MFFLTDSSYLGIFIVISLVTILIPLIIGFHWRWALGSFFACVFWGPLGLIYSIYVALSVIFGSEKITTWSPRELMEEFAENKVIQVILVIALIVLTAISILGGLIVIGLIFFYYKFSLLFMPARSEESIEMSKQKFLGYPSTSDNFQSSNNTITSTYSNNDVDYYSSSDDTYNNDNDDDDYDDDDDDDDGDSGSIWDGWLLKW